MNLIALAIGVVITADSDPIRSTWIGSTIRFRSDNHPFSASCATTTDLLSA